MSETYHFYLTVTGPRDALNRCAFDLDWTDSRKRAQCFHAVPERTADDLRQRGHIVTVSERLEDRR